MKALVKNITAELWYESEERLRVRVDALKKTFRCDEVVVSWDEGGIEKVPCTTQLWRTLVGVEHDEPTCYFRHWFKRADGRLHVCRFSHLALMPLVRSCVWQGLLTEFITGRLLNRDAVRLRVEDELEQYSNLSSKDIIRRIATLAQDFFGLVKNHLGATWRPLNRAGLGAAERIVINLPGYDCRSARNGWTNRVRRREIAQRIVDSGIAEIATRKEQEAYIWRWIGTEGNLKQSAAAAILKILCNYCDPETGEVVIKPWQSEELSEIRREARIRGTLERVMERAEQIRQKIRSGVVLTGAERYFKCRHKELFCSCEKPAQNAKNSPKHGENCKNKAKNQNLQQNKTLGNKMQNVNKSMVTNCILFPNANRNQKKSKNQSLHPIETYGDMDLMANKEQTK